MTYERKAMTLERQAFELWFGGSKYTQVVLPNTNTKQAARDGWQSALAYLSRAAEPVTKTADEPRALLLDQTLRQRAHSLRREACAAWSAVATPCDRIDEAKCQYAAAQEKYLGSVIDELADLTHPSEDARSQCVWSEDCEGNWETSCGNTFVLNEGTPYDNEMGFCCYCGHKLEQVTQQSAAMAKENCNGSD